MAVITAVTGSANWNVNGTWDLARQPTAADDVVIPASATVTIPASTTALGRSLTVQASGTLVFAATSSTLTLGDGTAGAGNVALSVSSSATVTLTGIGTINFVSTSATQQTITSGGKTLPNLIFNATSNGSWQFADNLTSSGTVTFTKGTLDTNSKTVVLASLNMTGGASTRTLTLGASAISSSGGNLLMVTGSGITVTANTATFTWNPQGTPQANGGGLNWNGASIVIQDGSGSAFQFTNPGTWANFTYNGVASKTGSLAFYTAGPTVTGTFTVTGNSVTNRVLVQSDTLGTARTITAAAASLTNVDFMDITGAGAATWSGTSLGDCLGNSGITFTTNSGTARDGGGAGVKRYAVVAGNWSSTATWSETSGGAGGASVPLPQDDVYLNASSAAGTYTQDMPRCGRNIDCTGFTRTLTWSINSTMYGTFTLGSGQTFTHSATLTFAGRGSHTITTNGKTLSNNTTVAGPGGTYTLQDALTCGAQFSLTNGTLDTAGLSFTTQSFSGGGSTIRGLLLGTSTVTITGTGTAWSFSSVGNLTFSGASATIVFSTASSALRQMVGGGLTYGTLQYTVANSPGALQINDSNTFTNLIVGPGRTLTLQATKTQTVTNPQLNGTVNGYWRAPNSSGSGASSPDSAALSITGDITIDVRVALDDWTPAAVNELVAKYQDASKVTYAFYVGTDGKLWLSTSSNGTTFNTNTSSVATGITDGAVKWVRGCLDVDNGSSQRVARFYTSDDGASWTQLGTTVTTAGATSIIDTTAQLEIGTDFNLQSNRASGNFYRVRIYNADLGAGSGTPVFDADFTTKPVGTNSFVESSANAATVTITGAIAQAGDGRLAIISSTPGTKATLAKAGGGQVWCDRVTFTDITGSPTDAWYSDYPLSSVTAVAAIPRQAVML